jgi:WD40 repeat protein
MFCGKTKMKPNDNFIIERRINIAKRLDIYFPKDISKLISNYDYYLEGKSYTFGGHTNVVTCIAVLSDGRIVSGSFDKTIKIWNLQTGLCDMTFEDTSWILCIAVIIPKQYSTSVLSDVPLDCYAEHAEPAERIISGSDDGTIKIWNSRTGLCDSIFLKLIRWIFRIGVLPDGRIITNSYHGEMNILNLDLQDDVFKIPYRGRFHCILPDGKVIIEENACRLSVYNTSTYTSDIIFETSSEIGTTDTYLNNSIINEEIEKNETKIKIWNLLTKNCDISFSVDQRTDEDFRIKHAIAVLSDGRIIRETNDNNLKIWNPFKQTDRRSNLKGKCDIILTGHSAWISQILALSDGRIVSCSYDKTIKIWS